MSINQNTLVSLTDDRIIERGETTDYDFFIHASWNRPVNINHVKKIKRQMSEAGFWCEFGVLIGKSRCIIDGQHRLEAAAELGIPVRYIWTDLSDDESRHLCIKLNEGRLSQKPRDYCHAFAEGGNANYIRLNCVDAALKPYEIELGVVIGTAQKMPYVYRLNDIKNGNLIFSEEDKKHGLELAELLKLIAQKHACESIKQEIKGRTRRADMLAFSFCSDIPGVNIDRLEGIIKNNFLDITASTDVSKIITSIDSVYNCRLTANSIDFVEAYKRKTKKGAKKR